MNSEHSILPKTTDAEKNRWTDLWAILSHSLIAALVLAMLLGTVALIDFLQSHFGLGDITGLVHPLFKWMEFAVLAIILLEFLGSTIGFALSVTRKIFQRSTER